MSEIGSNVEQVIVARSESSGKVEVVMRKHGHDGEVFIDGTKVERVTNVNIDLGVGRINTVQLDVNSEEIMVSLERARILQDTMAYMKLEPHETVAAIMFSREEKLLREIWESAHAVPTYEEWAQQRSMKRER